MKKIMLLFLCSVLEMHEIFGVENALESASVKKTTLVDPPKLVEAHLGHYSKIGRREDNYYGQYGQDRFFNEYAFKNKKEGVFVDIGAHNGISYSNTKFFEELGWKGICIEPNPAAFQLLEKNRTSICIQGCISDSNRKDQFLKVEGDPEMLSGLLSKYDPRHLERIRIETAAINGKAPKCIEVQCYLLNDLLEKHQFFTVDFLSIDTEGGEFEILKTIDFKKFCIRFVCVENNYEDQRIANFMKSQGYKLISNPGCDDFFEKI